MFESRRADGHGLLCSPVRKSSQTAINMSHEGRLQGASVHARWGGVCVCACSCVGVHVVARTAQGVRARASVDLESIYRWPRRAKNKNESKSENQLTPVMVGDLAPRGVGRWVGGWLGGGGERPGVGDDNAGGGREWAFGQGGRRRAWFAVFSYARHSSHTVVTQ